MTSLLDPRDIAFQLHDVLDVGALAAWPRYAAHSRETFDAALETAQGLAEEAREKSGEEATPIKQSQSGEFREFRFDFPVAGDQALLITEVLRANDATGTVATIVWQMPADEAPKLKGLREAVLSGIFLDPTR